MTQIIEFSIEQGDITSFDSDVVALKYAQGFYGSDKRAIDALSKVGIPIERLRPAVGEYHYLETWASTKARHALIVGVPSIQIFNYRHIRELATKVLGILAIEAPNTRHLAMTIHGIGVDHGTKLRRFLRSLQGILMPYKVEDCHQPLNTSQW